MFNILDTVALTNDIADAGLRRGDLGAIVEIHSSDAFDVEFVAASGCTQALLTLSEKDIIYVGDLDIIAVRLLEQADD